jgi:hypothetical protein
MHSNHAFNGGDAIALAFDLLSARPSPASFALFAWLISHQPVVLFSHNKPATSNQAAVLFSQNKSAPVISHQPNEQAGRFSVARNVVLASISSPSIAGFNS